MKILKNHLNHLRFLFLLIKIEYKLRNREIEKVNEELGIVFYDIFKADNHILSIVLKANGMIGWMVKNLFQGRQMLFKK